MSARPVFSYVLGAIALVLAWQFVIKPVLRHVKGFDEVQWRGQKFKLKQRYLDYEEYKSDTDQLATNEIEHVKAAMLANSVPKSAKTDQELIRSLRQMSFPGFGSSYAGDVRDEHGTRYIVNEYEIPQKGEQRTLVYRVDSYGTCNLVLDGVSIEHENDHRLGNSEVRVEGGKLKHLFDGKVYREIALDLTK